MNAEPLLAKIAKALKECRLEAVLIGNAAAALHGSPVTTLGFDFCVRGTRITEEKIRAFAKTMGATLARPGAPVSELIRVEKLEDGLQVDFLPDTSIGMRFASLRSRATRLKLRGAVLLVADLRDIVSGKKKAGRPKDRAALYAIEETIREKRRKETRT